ncbi:MAG: hypothetical protein ACJ77K_16615 [Bacteroidia bacterium]
MKRALYILSITALLFCLPFKGLAGNGGTTKRESAPDGRTSSGTDLNAEKIIATFEVQSFRISKDGMVSWTAKNESGSLPYVLEQYIFDKWVAVGKVNGVGSPTPNSYSLPVILNSGENKFRVKQKGYDKMSRFSDAVTFYSKKEPVSYLVTHQNRMVEFSGDTYFIVYNPFGAIVKQGYGNSINIADYAKGYYCLVYDNKLGGFDKRKVLLQHTFMPIVVKRSWKLNIHRKPRRADKEYSPF